MYRSGLRADIRVNSRSNERKGSTTVRACYRLFAAMNRIAKLVGLASALAAGEAVSPGCALRKGLPLTSDSPFVNRLFVFLLQGALGLDAAFDGDAAAFVRYVAER